jgi:small subunit ribosomal protein S8
VISTIQRVSKPGCRVYNGRENLPRVMGGLGVAIVSTNKGVMSDRKCRQENVGGELICTVS